MCVDCRKKSNTMKYYWSFWVFLWRGRIDKKDFFSRCHIWFGMNVMETNSLPKLSLFYFFHKTDLRLTIGLPITSHCERLQNVFRFIITNWFFYLFWKLIEKEKNWKHCQSTRIAVKPFQLLNSRVITLLAIIDQD